LEVITRYQRNRKNENLINIKNNSLWTSSIFNRQY
jgi:hypothetical protein